MFSFIVMLGFYIIYCSAETGICNFVDPQFVANLRLAFVVETAFEMGTLLAIYRIYKK